MARLTILLALLLWPFLALAQDAPPDTQTVKLLLAGDILPHMTLLQTARQPDGSYNFQPIFQPVRGLIVEADLAVASLETPLAGESYGYHGYPRFNAPDALAYDLRALGFDAVAAATNHSLDLDRAGLERTIAALASAGLLQAGLYPDGIATEPLLLDAHGIRVALLSYTEYANRPPSDPEAEFPVALLDPAIVQADVARARQAGAAFVVAYAHWGEEYATVPDWRQREQAHALCDAGVDLVIGTHPHMVQPLEWYTPPLSLDESRMGLAPRRCLIAYSLGNFASGQRGPGRDCGAVLTVELARAEGAAHIAAARYTPVVMRWGTLAGRPWCQVAPADAAAMLTLCPRPTFSELWRIARARAWVAWQLNRPAADASGRCASLEVE